MTCDCQHCDCLLEFDGEHAGKAVECPKCGKFTVLKAPTSYKVKPSNVGPNSIGMKILKVVIVLVLLGVIASVLGGWWANQSRFDRTMERLSK